MIEIYHNETDLTREMYVFSDWGGMLVLKQYQTQFRGTRRHNWRIDKKWNADDERSYISNVPRPVFIPQEVVDKLKAHLITELLAKPLMIGHARQEDIYLPNLEIVK